MLTAKLVFAKEAVLNSSSIFEVCQLYSSFMASGLYFVLNGLNTTRNVCSMSTIYCTECFSNAGSCIIEEKEEGKFDIFIGNCIDQSVHVYDMVLCIFLLF